MTINEIIEAYKEFERSPDWLRYQLEVLIAQERRDTANKVLEAVEQVRADLHFPGFIKRLDEIFNRK